MEIESISLVIAGKTIFEVVPGIQDGLRDICKRNSPHEWVFLGEGTIKVNGISEHPYRDLHQCRNCKVMRWLDGALAL